MQIVQKKNNMPISLGNYVFHLKTGRIRRFNLWTCAASGYAWEGPEWISSVFCHFRIFGASLAHLDTNQNGEVFLFGKGCFNLPFQECKPPVAHLFLNSCFCVVFPRNHHGTSTPKAPVRYNADIRWKFSQQSRPSEEYHLKCWSRHHARAQYITVHEPFQPTVPTVHNQKKTNRTRPCTNLPTGRTRPNSFLYFLSASDGQSSSSQKCLCWRTKNVGNNFELFSVGLFSLTLDPLPRRAQACTRPNLSPPPPPKKKDLHDLTGPVVW